jgi:hypothetical protein
LYNLNIKIKLYNTKIKSMEEKDIQINDKIDALREMIKSAEKTLQGAKSVLLQMEGKKKVGRRRKASTDETEEGKIIEGAFDGQVMIGTDGKQYPVPANYASKSKLVEGDMLKLTITNDGSFIYKQIGPAERKRLIGIVSQDADGNYFVAADGQAYKVLLASITYFKVSAGDEVTLVAPRDIDSDWGAIENVIQKGENIIAKPLKSIDEIIANDKPRKTSSDSKASSLSEQKDILDEWAPDLEELKKELSNHE